MAARHGSSQLLMSAFFTFTGERPDAAVPFVVLQFAARAANGSDTRPQLWYERDHRLHLLMNGASRADLGEGDYETYTGYQDATFEVMQYSVSSELLSRIGSSEKVEGRIGHTEFRLSPSQIAALSTLHLWSTPTGFEEACAGVARSAILFANTARDRYPRLTQLIEGLERIQQECVGIWPDELERILSEMPEDDSVAYLFHVNQPSPGLIVATQTGLIQILAAEPMLTGITIPYTGLSSISFFAHDPTFGIVGFTGSDDGGERNIAAIIDGESYLDAKALIEFVSKINNIPIT